MIISFIRAFILYAVIVVGMRLMGKRQLGQLQPFELVVALMIADLASVPMQDIGKPLLSGILPILALLLAELTLSFLNLKSERIRSFICGSPCFLIEHGKINYNEMKKQRMNLNDLLEQLRTNNIPNPADVEYAILETGGQLNIIPKAEKRPATPEDLNIAVPKNGIPITLILDGHINHKNLKTANRDMAWLNQQLKDRNLRAGDVFLASLDAGNRLDIQPRERGEGQ